jgi:hypothetical protein
LRLPRQVCGQLCVLFRLLVVAACFTLGPQPYVDANGRLPRQGENWVVVHNFDRRSTGGEGERSAEASPRSQPTARAPSGTKATWSYAVVRLPSPEQSGDADRVELGILASDQPGLICWEPGSAPSPLPDGYSIVKRYAVDVTEPSMGDWERAQLEFAREFPPQAIRPRPVPAWLAPDGRFYACRWLEHDRLSYRLSAHHYGNAAGTRALESLGWLRIQRDGTIVRAPSTRSELTQPQLDVLFSLAQVAEGDYRDNIHDGLELVRLRARLDASRLSDDWKQDTRPGSTRG